MSTAKIRDVKVWSPQIDWEEKPDGSIRVWRNDVLEPYPDHMSERIFHWAKEAPDRIWMAERNKNGGWEEVTYQKLASMIQSVAQALIDLEISAERPVMILSGNSLKHAVLVLAAQHIGIPTAAISTGYSLASDDFGKLEAIGKQILPGLVFVEQAKPFKNAIAALADKDTVVVCGHGEAEIAGAITWDDLLSHTPTDAVALEYAKTGPDTVAKFLFTSGTTGSPKAVIQTQRMLCANQQQVLNCFSFMQTEPPIFLDWAPWNHTASGNKVFNMTIYNGGTYYIDGGKPTATGMAETIKNLHEISPTWYFNVPAGYEMLLEAMTDDRQLRESFFRDVKMLMYAGAGLAGHIWDQLKSMAVETVGEEILLTTGLGATETGPFSLYCTDAQDRPGNIGIPAQGVELKLVPSSGKLEVRLKGPNITPGYWRDANTTAKAIDDEGFYCMGDALRFDTPGDPTKGFHFDGRIAENFKLSTGTWVATGSVRNLLNDALGGVTRDVVIAGEGRNELGALLIPFRPAIERIVPGGSDMSDHELLAHPALRTEITNRIEQYVEKVSGSSRRVVRFMFLEQPLEMKRGELTEKGSVNQRAVLRNNTALVEILYSDDPRIFVASRKKIEHGN
ncbi:MAG: feruloyl-CoA synthase [Paracoccaceae bacterium]